MSGASDVPAAATVRLSEIKKKISDVVKRGSVDGVRDRHRHAVKVVGPFPGGETVECAPEGVVIHVDLLVVVGDRPWNRTRRPHHVTVMLYQ